MKRRGVLRKLRESLVDIVQILLWAHHVARSRRRFWYGQEQEPTA